MNREVKMTKRGTNYGSSLPRPAGPYSQCVRIGNLVAVSGQVGVGPEDGAPIANGVAAQTRQALDNLRHALASQGASQQDIIRVGVFLTEIHDFVAMNEVYGTFFTEPYPARTTVYVDLPPGLRVEIDALAVLSSGEEL
jgi:reactive intermediate/imine deaminase